MAELDTSSGGGHKKGSGVKKAKKLSTRVDLTPMVDLGFLLITFFIFTTTLSQPSTMKLNMPKDDVDQKDLTPIKESGALTIIMGKNNQVYYYLGIDPNKLQSSSYTKIRDVILAKKASTPPDDLFITIKPDEDATYENAVAMLDEMKIDAIEHYAIDKPSDAEMKDVHATEQANGIE
jgi:biopolymer transport protein ExbD